MCLWLQDDWGVGPPSIWTKGEYVETSMQHPPLAPGARFAPFVPPK